MSHKTIPKAQTSDFSEKFRAAHRTGRTKLSGGTKIYFRLVSTILINQSQPLLSNQCLPFLPPEKKFQFFFSSHIIDYQQISRS
jgi:hypothetical protein